MTKHVDDTCCWRAAEQGKEICPVCGQVLGLYRMWTEWAKENGIKPGDQRMDNVSVYYKARRTASKKY